MRFSPSILTWNAEIAEMALKEKCVMENLCIMTDKINFLTNKCADPFVGSQSFVFLMFSS